jgi:flagellar FliL protein
MAANRIAPAAESAESSANGEAAPQAAPASGGFKAWLPLIITVLLMPALAYAMTSFVLLPRLQKGLGMAAANSSPESGSKDSAGGSKQAKKERVAITKLLVNVAGTMGGRYLLVSISVEGSDPQFKEKMQDADPKLRDMACGALRLKTLADLEKPTAQNLIRTELITGFNEILGGPVVQDIYFTEFAIQ